jgi:hypothetical protein
MLTNGDIVMFIKLTVPDISTTSTSRRINAIIEQFLHSSYHVLGQNILSNAENSIMNTAEFFLFLHLILTGKFPHFFRHIQDVTSS